MYEAYMYEGYYYMNYKCTIFSLFFNYVHVGCWKFLDLHLQKISVVIIYVAIVLVCVCACMD